MTTQSDKTPTEIVIEEIQKVRSVLEQWGLLADRDRDATIFEHEQMEEIRRLTKANASEDDIPIIPARLREQYPIHAYSEGFETRDSVRPLCPEEMLNCLYGTLRDLGFREVAKTLLSKVADFEKTMVFLEYDDEVSYV